MLLRDSCRLWHLVKFNTAVAVNFSNSTYISTLPFIYALTVNLQKILYNSQTSVDGRQYTIILFISIIFLPTILIYLNDSERGHHYLLLNFSASPMSPPHTPPTPQYLFIVMTERGRHYLLYNFSAPSMPPPSPEATILIYLNDREGAPLFYVGLWRPPPPNAPHPPQTSQYLTILMTERGSAIIFCRIVAPPNTPPPPSPDVTIFNYLSGTGGRQLQYPVRS